MRQKITILIGNEVCTAELLTDLAPKTCRIIQDALPLTGVLTHAKLGQRGRCAKS